jgi:hypothetical protein
MNPIIGRLAALAAIGTMGVAAPVAGASVSGVPAGCGAPCAPHSSLRFALPVPAFPLTGFPAFPAFPAVPFGLGAPVGQVATVIGPNVITTAPSVFNNTNIQVSAGSAVGGGQFGP